MVAIPTVARLIIMIFFFKNKESVLKINKQGKSLITEKLCNIRVTEIVYFSFQNNKHFYLWEYMRYNERLLIPVSCS